MSDEQKLELEEKEREEILEEIDELVATNRLPVSEEMGKLKPQKSGIGFPLLINLFAVAAVVSTFYFSSRLFEQRQEDLNIENATYLSAEGKLLEELKKESAQQLEQKDQVINSIQNELAELDRQSRELAATMDQQISNREIELRLALQAELDKEREKLKAQGKSETAISEELKQIEMQRSAQYEEELSDFRAQTAEAISEKEEELAQAKALNEELLAEVNSDKLKIQNESRQREAELTAQFELEKAALADEAAAAESQLRSLSANQAKESLVIDQINGSYKSIFTSIETGNTDEALRQLDALTELIEDPSIALLSAVNERRVNDRVMISLIRKRIEEQAYKEDVDTTSLTAAADLLLSAQEIAGLGTRALNEGNTAEAEKYYTRSLEKIPALSRAWKNLDQIKRNLERERLSTLLAEGEDLEEKGLNSEAVLQYAEAASAAFTYNPELLQNAVSGILKTTDAESNSAIASLKSSINNIENEKNEEISRLTRLVGERDQKNLELNTEKEAAEAELSEARTAIEEGRAYIAELELDSKAQIEQLRSSSSEKAEELKTSSLAELEALKAASEAEIIKIQAETDSKIAELNIELAAMEAEYTELEEKYNLSKEVESSKLRAAQVTGYNNGLLQGRSGALEDVLSFTSYLEGSTGTDSAAEAEISEIASSEALYAETIQKIQDLAKANSSLIGGELQTIAQPLLIGSISYASGNQIIIEPLTELSLESGTRITVKRKERGRDEYYITFGIVTSANAGKITARTDPAGTVQAQSMDLVYITR